MRDVALHVSGQGREGAQRFGRGVVQVMLGEALVLPAGIVVSAFLGRSLGPEVFGALAVALAVSSTIEWTIIAMFSRATVQVVAEASDWRSMATSVFRTQVAVGLAAGSLLALSAPVIAAQLGEMRIVWALRLLGLELPILSAASACRNVLTGRRLYRERAIVSGTRWTSRLIYIVILVQSGFSIVGAVVGGMLASLTSLTLGLTFSRIPVFGRGAAGGMQRMWNFALPLFVLALCLRLLDKIGLIALKLLGGSATEAGWYAAAQNFTIAPGLFALSFSPLLLGALATAASREGGMDAARPLARNAQRIVLGLVPFAAFGASAAPEIVRLIYGAGYEPAARLAIPLICGSMGFVMISVSSVILAAAEQARTATRIVWPILPTAIVLLSLVVPRYGAMGAAMVTGMASLASAVGVVLAVRATWQISPPTATLVRSVIIGAATLVVGLAFPAYGPWLLVKAAIAVTGIVIAFAVLGEFDAGDWQLARTLIGNQPSRDPGL